MKTKLLFKKEVQSSSEYLKPVSVQLIIKVFLAEAVLKKADHIFCKSTGLHSMIDNDKHHHVRLMYDLFRISKDTLQIFQNSIIDHICK